MAAASRERNADFFSCFLCIMKYPKILLFLTENDIILPFTDLRLYFHDILKYYIFEESGFYDSPHCRRRFRQERICEGAYKKDGIFMWGKGKKDWLITGYVPVRDSP
jgi:hypothetical protein